MISLHNDHLYAVEDPHAIKPLHSQREFKINVKAGIIDRFIKGFVILSTRLNGLNYLEYLANLPIFYTELSLTTRQSL